MITPDIEAAIGNPTDRKARWTDLQIGVMMKAKAREMIDAGEITTDEDIKSIWDIRSKWIVGMPVSEDTKCYWLKFETAFVRSARKYLAIIREAKMDFKK